MSPEVNEKEEKREKVSVTIPDVPIEVHEKMDEYKRKISFERKKDFGLMEAYREFVIEHTKNLAL
jgi:hypothetical protein